MSQLTFHNNIKNCKICKDFLPNSPKPIIAFNSNSKIIIIGQAPGSVVHENEIPFDDRSGDTLREWLGVTQQEFYNTDNFAIVPMSFCYPGKGKTGGDAPPRKECAPEWHNQVMDHLKNVQLIVLIGKYAQDYYLGKSKERNLTETVMKVDNYLPKYFPIVHPSPLNFRWHIKNKWFVKDILPILQNRIREILNN